MIPIGDSTRRTTFPYVNVAIISINLAVFLYELTLSATPPGFSQLDRFLVHWAVVPACLSDFVGAGADVPARQLSFICGQNHEQISPLTSMFIHGGWLHLLSNMLFLWIFGDNIEDAFGHIRYLLFYLLCGVAAVAAQVAATQAFTPADELIPSIGASGAIAGVMGAYVFLYPRASVVALIFIIPVYVPAVFLIGLWFFIQVINGLASIGTAAVGAGGGVAWFAHIGGFLLGLLLAPLLHRRRPPPRVIRLGGDEL